MIPKNDNSLIGFYLEPLPGKTYALDPTTNRIRGFVDSLEALKQTIYLILSVERYESLIFSWNYGSELQKLIGQPASFVLPEIKRCISEALVQDDRIISVDCFDFEVAAKRVKVTFTVHTVLGNIEWEKEVAI